MGVTGLWQIVQPCARPIKIETLNRKRLAVDASIWIYQFLKAVRDKEGNALRNSHVIGFFRRICKLLFFGIKPVFVFDGGAPALKRQTIMGRKRRREGRREDAARTAGKLLAVQMQRLAEEEEAKRKDAQNRNRAAQAEEDVADEEIVYAEEMGMSAQERQQSRKFKKTDQYHLPELDVSMHEMGGSGDMRVMSLEELETYARQFDTGEDINVYDFSKIDYDSDFFVSLPASDRYNILNAARLRSRLRMGHSKEQLDSMFPDRMAFSKFQIERVAERNELTQRLMNINDPNGDFEFGVNGTGRVSGEKGREYVLVKNDGVEGGWALGVVTNEGTQEKPINVDKPADVQEPKDEESDDDGFEDVPIEGLNRLPKPTFIAGEEDPTRKRQALFDARRQASVRKPRRAPRKENTNSLFVAEEADEDEPEEWEDVEGNAELFGESNEQGEEDEELQRAIAMSLQQDEQAAQPDAGNDDVSDEEDRNRMLDAFQQKAAEESRPIPQGSARAIASILNKRAHNNAPDSREVTSFGVPKARQEESEEEDDAMDLQAALAKSRSVKPKTNPTQRRESSPAKKKADPTRDMAKKAGFSGPLPFEKLDLGSSLLGKKKMEQRTEEAAGGFENPELAAKQKKKAEPLPPWFSGNIEEDVKRQRALELEDRERTKEFNKQFQFSSREAPVLGRGDREIIDLDAEDDEPKRPEVIDLDSEEEKETMSKEEPRMDDVAEVVRAKPPVPSNQTPVQIAPQPSKAGPFQADDSDEEDVQMTEPVEQVAAPVKEKTPARKKSPSIHASEQADADDEEIEWSESEHGNNSPAQPKAVSPVKEPSKSPSMEFEDVPPAQKIQQPVAHMPSAQTELEDLGIPLQAESPSTPAEADEPTEDSASVPQPNPIQEIEEDFDDFSDPEEEELLKALTLEAEEHARFASQLNNKTQAQNIADYEQELKQLRNQQKKDRRDADEVTNVMVAECQQLLRLFGLPYITAPMEAEAQCAELVRLGQVDGIVTDDSDCFLFGGTRVYKNMFNQAKFVECYLTSDMEKEFELTREKLIQVAHLLGSDYTEGLPGVGPVTALEILSEFHTLADFRDWWAAVQMQQITKEDDKDKPFRRKFRRNATKLFLPPVFPDQRVDTAYLEPEVDSDPEGFQWGVPDLGALRDFLMATIGWSQERTDEVLVPVIRDMNRRMDEGTQANITAFFDGSVGIGAAGASASGGTEAFAPRQRVAGSKRMGNALDKLAQRARSKRAGGVDEAEEVNEAVEEEPVETPAPKTTSRKRKTPKRTTAVPSDDDEDESDYEAPQKKRATFRRRGKQTTTK